MDLFHALAARAAGEVPLLVPRTLSRYAGDVGMTAGGVGMTATDDAADVLPDEPTTRRAHASNQHTADSAATPAPPATAMLRRDDDDASSTIMAPPTPLPHALRQRPAPATDTRARDPVMDAIASTAGLSARSDAVEHRSERVVADDPAFVASPRTSPAASRRSVRAASRTSDDDQALLEQAAPLAPPPPTLLALDTPATSRSSDATRDQPMLVARGPLPLQSLAPVLSPPSSSQQRHSTSMSTSNEQHVEVTIGRVEVRAVTPPAQQPQRRAVAEPQRLSLDEYLRRRPGGGA